jgi:very-short-patch-repair endonuclease
MRSGLIQKHVDFVIISLPECRPVLAIELDGASHLNAKQQFRDAVKDAAFAKSGLELVRIENGQVTKNRVQSLLKPHLKLEPVLG